ncbi:MAG TPA: tetratricopeptide repeat protein [Gemmataceae bacterium]|jgi:tetratricopeptide (TPR) repeat protein|nr:tetratricopeptide repeat protein [Gemmataceae bacterium]
MRKSSSKVLKKPNKSAAKNGLARSLNGPKKAKNASTTPSEKLRSRKIIRRNSNKDSSWKNDPELNQILQQGIYCKDNSDYQGAISAFEEAIRKSPQCSLAYWLLGGVHYTFLNDPRAALPYFQKGVQLSPKTEIASLALFHSLWDTDQTFEALEELKRYQLLTNWSSKDYLEIMQEIKEKWLDPPKTKKRSKKVKS